MVNNQFPGNSSFIYYVTIVNTEEEISITYSLSEGAPYSRFVLTYSGEYQLESWKPSGWAIVWKWFTDKCNLYGYCGPYGYCDNSVPDVTCKCLNGFEPVSLEEWNRGRFSQGCRQKEARKCSDGFLALPGMKAPDKFILVKNRNFKECAAECTMNCSCVAYAYSNMSTSTMKGDGTRCFVWTTDLIDTENYGNSAASDTLYLRIAGLDDGIREKTNVLKIVLPTILISSILIPAGVSLHVTSSKVY
ncbi:hypothetical protein QOZ80_6BG0480790 [Eleusine coracana subsp. coracana]|nr:hypothetical protein QOZ80_6BG0480790 [Eleusine coracana subsp. coracana]